MVNISLSLIPNNKEIMQRENTHTYKIKYTIAGQDQFSANCCKKLSDPRRVPTSSTMIVTQVLFRIIIEPQLKIV